MQALVRHTPKGGLVTSVNNVPGPPRVMLSAAKHLGAPRDGSFATLRMTPGEAAWVAFMVARDVSTNG